MDVKQSVMDLLNIGEYMNVIDLNVEDIMAEFVDPDTIIEQDEDEIREFSIVSTLN